MLFSSCENGLQQPAISALMKTLKHIMEVPKDAYIIIDALDECADREELIQVIEEMNGWKFRNLHLLVTSRKERDISDSFDTLNPKEVGIQSALVDADLKIYIQDKLTTDPKLRKWPAEVRDEIQQALEAGSNGM